MLDQLRSGRDDACDDREFAPRGRGAHHLGLGLPHPDAKFPGVTDDLDEATRGLDEAQRARIIGLNAAELYGLPAPVK